MKVASVSQRSARALHDGNKSSLLVACLAFLEGCILGGWGSFAELYLSPETFFREGRYRFFLGFLSDDKVLHCRASLYCNSLYFGLFACLVLSLLFHVDKRIGKAAAFFLGFFWGGIGSIFLWRAPL